MQREDPRRSTQNHPEKRLRTRLGRICHPLVNLIAPGLPGQEKAPVVVGNGAGS